MTLEQLHGYTIEQLEAMSDAELFKLFEPCLKATRPSEVQSGNSGTRSGVQIRNKHKLDRRRTTNEDRQTQQFLGDFGNMLKLAKEKFGDQIKG